jgi:hypothetical protein
MYLCRAYQGSTQVAGEPESVRYKGRLRLLACFSRPPGRATLVYDVGHQTPMVGGRVPVHTAFQPS